MIPLGDLKMSNLKQKQQAKLEERKDELIASYKKEKEQLNDWQSEVSKQNNQTLNQISRLAENGSIGMQRLYQYISDQKSTINRDFEDMFQDLDDRLADEQKKLDKDAGED